MKSFGIIGAGRMAGAILDRALRTGTLTPGGVLAYDVNPDRRGEMTARGAACADSLGEIAARCSPLLLSVKPQVAPQVLRELAGLLPSDTVILSIVAGVSAQAICGYLLNPAAKVIQIMPNTPIMVGMGAAVLCRTSTVGEEEFAFAKGLFAAAGVAEELPQDKINESIAVHGSTPAYLYLIAKYFCEYAAGQGIPLETANRLFCQTMAGAARMMTETGLTHQELIDMVTSPGGTTLAGLRSLEEADLKQIIGDCCDATIRRAYELGK